jgi:hypothetical protein
VVKVDVAGDKLEVTRVGEGSSDQKVVSMKR